MGVWIETRMVSCGWCRYLVTPFVGVWIETHFSLMLSNRFLVTPFVGVWIETLKVKSSSSTTSSHPSWVCGLKQQRGEREGVRSIVTPFVGVWIETCICCKGVQAWFSHTLRGCVDWNRSSGEGLGGLRRHTLRGCVDWNYNVVIFFAAYRESHPSWVCGLKHA